MMTLMTFVSMVTSCADIRIIKLNPSSVISKKEQALQAFDRVDLEASANVKIIQSKEKDYRLVFSAPENYMSLYDLEVEDGELEFKFRRGIDNYDLDAEHIDLTIYTPRLKSLENGGVSNVEIDRYDTPMLEVENSGVGSMFLSGLKVNHLEAECSGVGSIELSGTAVEAVLECSGVGSIKAHRLVAKRVKADVSGVGGIKCHATLRLDGDVSGVGTLEYAGDPKEKHLNSSGIGGVKRM